RCRRPPGRLHHFVRHAAKDQGIGLREVLDMVTMQLFVRDDYTMIAAPVQCDVDGIPKRSHYVRVSPVDGPRRSHREVPVITNQRENVLSRSMRSLQSCCRTLPSSASCRSRRRRAGSTWLTHDPLAPGPLAPRSMDRTDSSSAGARCEDERRSAVS